MNRFFSFLILMGGAGAIFYLNSENIKSFDDSRKKNNAAMTSPPVFVPLAQKFEVESSWEINPFKGSAVVTAEERDKLVREKDSYFQFMIKKHPGHEPLFRYADYLFFNERYSEANRYLEECLKFSECKTRGEIIKKGIERLQSSQDPVSNTDVWLDVSRSLAEVDTAEAKEVQVPQDKMELVSKDLKEVETQNESQGYVPTEVEADRLNIVQSYEVDWELELAANGYERLINDHPDSPFTQLAYVRFLVRQGKMEQALSRVSFVEDSYPSFRNEPEWLILTQTLTSQKTLSPFEVDLKIANQLRDRRANLNQIGIALSEPLFPPTALSEK